MPATCEICNHVTRDKWSLADHMKRHNGLIDYECGICGALFKYNFSEKQ